MPLGVEPIRYQCPIHCRDPCELPADTVLDEAAAGSQKFLRPYPTRHQSASFLNRIPFHLLSRSSSQFHRLYSTQTPTSNPPELTHLTPSGSARMVSISSKDPTKRTATAVCSIHFSNATALPLIRENRAKKGDVLGVARVAGIMAAKRTADLIPLCHPIAITHVSVELQLSHQPERNTALGAMVSIPWAGTGQGDAYKWPADREDFGKIDITATVSCDGKTGVEMEALMAASTAALTVYDMCKAVDRGMRVEGLRVVRKEGGKSGNWIEGPFEEATDESIPASQTVQAPTTPESVART